MELIQLRACNLSAKVFPQSFRLKTTLHKILEKYNLPSLLMTSKSVTGSLWQSFRHTSVALVGRIDFADRQ